MQDYKNILLVDDSPLILGVLTNLLSAEGFNVYKSENGKEALTVLASKEVDLILCDIMMPEMNGWELHRQVRDRQDLQHVPFVFLTSVSEQNEINDAKKQGADDFVIKPFNPTDLLALIKGKLKRASAVRELIEDNAEKVKKNLIQSVSHELRTPLVAIKTGAEMLLYGDLPNQDDVKKDILEAIARGGERIESFIEEVFIMKDIEAKKIHKENSSINLAKVVDSFLSKKAESLKQFGFNLEVELDYSLTANISANHFLAILKRLLSNAIKFSKQEFQITIRVFQDHEFNCLEIADRGIGLGNNKSKEAFKAFTQFDREKLEQQGVGLGLTIANFYSSLYQAKITLENRPSGGAVARLYLPNK